MLLEKKRKKCLRKSEPVDSLKLHTYPSGMLGSRAPALANTKQKDNILP